LFLRTFLYTGTALFVGFGAGLADPNFSALRRWLRTVLASSTYQHYRVAREAQVTAFQAQHDSDEHIRVISSGPDYADLPVFLRSITIGVHASGLRGLAAGTDGDEPVARRSPDDPHIPLPDPPGRRQAVELVLAAAERLRGLQQALDGNLLSGQDRERAARYTLLFAEEITDLERAADRVEELTPPQLAQARSWGDKLIQILDAPA
jgi:hypothetical protein